MLGIILSSLLLPFKILSYLSSLVSYELHECLVFEHYRYYFTAATSTMSKCILLPFYDEFLPASARWEPSWSEQTVNAANEQSFSTSAAGKLKLFWRWFEVWAEDPVRENEKWCGAEIMSVAYQHFRVFESMCLFASSFSCKASSDELPCYIIN